MDRAIANANGFTREFQELITRYAWGTIWTRPVWIRGFDGCWCWPSPRRSDVGRSFDCTSGLAAAELEPADLKEVLLQVAVYAGVPSANTGFHIAGEELPTTTEDKKFW